MTLYVTDPSLLQDLLQVFILFSTLINAYLSRPRVGDMVFFKWLKIIDYDWCWGAEVQVAQIRQLHAVVATNKHPRYLSTLSLSLSLSLCLSLSLSLSLLSPLLYLITMYISHDMKLS